VALSQRAQSVVWSTIFQFCSARRPSRPQPPVSGALVFEADGVCHRCLLGSVACHAEQTHR